MSNTLLHNHGEEWVADLIINSGKTFQIGLYNDDTDVDGDGTSEGDQLSDGSDLSAITTEPSGSAYGRQSDAASNFTASLDSNNDVVITGTEQTFDVSDSSQTVDSVFIVVPFASDLVSSDSGTTTDHLVFTNGLDQSYDLGQFDSTVDLDPTELTLD